MLFQTVLPEEILIVADGPLTDQLDEVIEKYTTEHERLFTVVRLERNMGMGVAMDTGLRACRNEWVARMDSDDLAIPERFEKQVKFLQDHPKVDILGAFISEFGAEPGDIGRERRVPEYHQDICRYMKKRNPMNHMTVFFRKKVALAAGSYWHNRMLEDYHLWYKMMKAGAILHNIQEVLVHARIGNDMVGRRRGMAYIRKDIEFFRLMRNEGFLSATEFYKNAVSRALVRMLPKGLLQVIYKTVLRK
ncbi:glycosyltransferase [Chitinophaga horti]|uniref:Glycosyltransferase n=1 Tax=Chitinophaga horti TaxID=2920382 RepID=A0ABY6IYF2_9BACT|nr:glycosyltransferase [Chitinophaga horti]UYQ92419.1 glycosyltransferase [Chitinophaga horti]